MNRLLLHHSAAYTAEDISIERLKIAFSIEDLSAWAVSCNADEKVLREAKSLMDAIYSSNYSKRKNAIRDMSGLPAIPDVEIDCLLLLFLGVLCQNPFPL